MASDTETDYYNEHPSTAQDWQDTLAEYRKDFEHEVSKWPSCSGCGVKIPPEYTICEACRYELDTAIVGAKSNA